MSSPGLVINSTSTAAPSAPAGSVRLTSETVTLGDVDFCMHEWTPTTTSSETAAASNNPSNNAAAAIVIIFHGFLAHGLYPTVRYAAEFLSSSNNHSSTGTGGTCCYTVVVAPDLRGHGNSSGLAGYLPSADIVIDDGVAIVEHVAQKFGGHHSKIVLLGSSMGGTIALQVAMKLKMKQNASTTNSSSSGISIAGVILLAPMLKLNVDMVSRNILYALAQVTPTWRIIPANNSSSAEKQYRDVAKRQECETDVYSSGSDGDSNHSKIRVASASTCVELAARMQQDDFCKRVDFPFYLAVADQDYVVDNQGSLDLFRESTSKNKTMKMYPALHGLLCEPSPLVDEIQNDILTWLRKLQCS
jgi:acylglycerol lipase